MRDRVAWIDVARGIGILSVIVGHTVVPASDIAFAIFTFHLPLFFVLSGYCSSFDAPFCSFVARKARSLLLPYVATLVIYYAYWALFYRGYSHDSNGFLHIAQVCLLGLLYGTGQTVAQAPWIQAVGPVWFLPALFSANVVAYAVSRIAKPGFERLAVVAMCAVAGMCLGHVLYMPWGLDVALVAQAFIFAGSALKAQRLSPLLLGLSLVAYLVSWQYHGLDLNDRYYSDLMISCVGAVGGSIVVIFFAQQLAKVAVPRAALEYIGRASIVILCFHVFDVTHGHFDRIAPTAYAFLAAHVPLWVTLRLAFSLAIYETFRMIPVIRLAYSLPGLQRQRLAVAASS